MITKDCFNTDMLQVIFDAMPSSIFVVDDDVRIQKYNDAAGVLIGDRKTILKHCAGDVLHCLHSTETPEGCGHAPFCKECIIRNSVTKAFQGKRVVRKRTKIEIIQDDKKIKIYALITCSPFHYQEKEFVLLVVEDISELAELQRIVPICMHCKGIRDDKGYWNQLEKYISEHSVVQFSHCICDKCLKKYYPEEADLI